MNNHLGGHALHQTDTTTDGDAGWGFGLEEAEFDDIFEEAEDENDKVPVREGNSIGELKTWDRTIDESDNLLDTIQKNPAFRGKVPHPGFDLESLLVESLEEAETSAAVKAGRKRLIDRRITPKERTQIESVIKAWELTKEWRPAAAVHVFNTQRCGYCCSENSTYAGLFQRQIHRSSAITRWVTYPNGSGNSDGLPRENKRSVTESPVCIECCEEQGFGPWELL